MPHNIVSAKSSKWMRLLAMVLIAAGIVLRLYIYLQNRNLIIDEANVARNIVERGFIELLSPLSYQQFAPPVFLWVTKFFSLLFGMGEMALRLYPLICGCVSLVVFYSLLKKIMPLNTIWYPLALLVFGAIFIRYSSELKQYTPDVLIALLLLWLALKIDINRTKPFRFVAIWMVAGSIAIWTSMPSVFILAGVGAYYGWQAIREKDYKKLLPVILVGALWLSQFALYYFLMLKEQANSNYLQNFHHYDFLFATPSKREEWQHNWHVFSALMRQFEGLYPYVHDINTAFLICGVVVMVRKATARFFLIVTPILGLCVAASIDQFSLLPRVSMFIIPLIIIIIGYGFSQIVYLKSVWLKGILLVAALYAGGCNIAYLNENRPFKYEELTEGMQYLQNRDIASPSVLVYHSSVPAFIYYTQLHPDKEKWAKIKNAYLMDWYTNYDSMSWQLHHIRQDNNPVGFLYTNCTKEEFDKRNNDVNKNLLLKDKLDKPYIKTYVYIKPQDSAE